MPMKYIKKMPSTNKELSIKLQNEGWKKLKEPSNMMAATLYSMPFAFMLGGIVVLITVFLNPSLFQFLQKDSYNFTLSFNLFTILYIIIIFAFIMLHELIHALFIPNFIRSDKTFWGINGLFGFVFTTEPIKKGRFIIISIMPCVLLSFLLPFILNLFRLLNGYTLFLCLLNAMGSCVDFLNVCLIAFQVPKGQTIINNGFETYYTLIK